MKCAVCHAHLARDTPACPHCGHTVEVENAPKKTMMGLPAILPTSPTSAPKTGTKPAHRVDRNTLYGTPAVLDDAHRHGAVDTPNDDSSERDGSTQIAPPSLVEAALSGSFATSVGLPAGEGKSKNSQSTEFGLPAVARDPKSSSRTPESYSQAWGLEQDSDEVDEDATRGSTQVAGASMLAAIRDSKFDLPAVQDRPAAPPHERSAKHTMMGLNFGISQEDSTRPIDTNQLASIRSKISPAAILSGRGALAEDSSAQEVDGGPATQALKPADLAALERNDGSEKRKNLLSKLRANSDKSTSSQTARRSPGGAGGPAFHVPSPTPAEPEEDLELAPLEPPEVQEIVEIEALEPLDDSDVFDPFAEPDIAPPPVESWGRGPRFSIPEPTQAPSAPALRPDAYDELDAYDDDGADEFGAGRDESGLVQESFVSQEFPNTDDLEQVSLLDASHHQHAHNALSSLGATSSAHGGRGVFDSLDGIPADLVLGEDALLEDPAALSVLPDQEIQPAPAQPDPSSKAGAVRVIRIVCAALGALGLTLAALGAVILLGGEGLGVAISATVATICLVVGCVLCACTGLFVLALKWIS